MPVERSAGAVVFRHAPAGLEFLLLRATFKTTFWKPPKGLIEPGASEEETALCETKEETGLDVRLLPGFREKVNWFYRREGKTVYKEAVYFLGEADPRQEVRLSSEHEAAEWLTPAQAIDRASHATDKEVLRKAAAFLAGRLTEWT